jgi:hypothetical protein
MTSLLSVAIFQHHRRMEFAFHNSFVILERCTQYSDFLERARPLTVITFVVEFDFLILFCCRFQAKKHHFQYILCKVIFLTYMEHDILLRRATNIPQVVMATSAFDYPAYPGRSFSKAIYVTWNGGNYSQYLIFLIHRVSTQLTHDDMTEILIKLVLSNNQSI